MDAASLVAIIGGIFAGVGTLMGVFMKYISSRDKAEERRQKAQELRDQKFVKSLSENTKAMKSVASETAKAAREAAERNGHLAEIAADNQKANSATSAKILEAIGNLPVQHVGKQVVDHQEIKE